MLSGPWPWSTKLFRMSLLKDSELNWQTTIYFSIGKSPFLAHQKLCIKEDILRYLHCPANTLDLLSHFSVFSFSRSGSAQVPTWLSLLAPLYEICYQSLAPKCVWGEFSVIRWNVFLTSNHSCVFLEWRFVHFNPSPTSGWPSKRRAALREVESYPERQVNLQSFLCVAQGL